ncbi:hypothetical protein [Amycolatopsis sp. NPDC001319]|uniref:hypothetical protein n=1 Tax=unclassified Amycolatopsis TaxID=2618356 RepID=UPI0036874095
MAVVNADGDGFWSAMPNGSRVNNARQGRALVQSLFLGGTTTTPLAAVRSGVIPTVSDGTFAYDGRVTVQSGRTLNVNPVAAVIGRSGQGGYLAWTLPPAKTVTCDTPPATNPRNDIVVARAYDTTLSDVIQGGGVIPLRHEIITGTPGAVPVDPVSWDSLGLITSFPGAGGGVGIPLARAQVSTSGTVTITDLRRSTGLLGGVRVLLPGDSLSDPSFMPSDMRWFNGLDIWDGTKWNPVWRTTTPLGVLGVHRPTAAVSSSGTTEKVACFVTATLVSGRRYKATWNGDLSSSNSNTNNLTNVNPALIRLRYKAGTSSTAVDGTLFEARDLSGLSNGYNVPADLFGDFVAPSSGQYTVSATICAATSAAGNVTQAYNATGHLPKLIVEDIGI